MLFMAADLSPRERQVMDLTCDGYTLKEIAYELGISESAARHLRDRAVGKYGAPSTTVAAIIHDRRSRRRSRRAVTEQDTLGLA